MVTNALVRATLLGAAAGARSATPLAALARQSSNGWVRTLATVAAGGELIADKLPGTPSRTKPGPLGARIVTGALVGGLDARRRQNNVVVGALVAASATVAASYAGVFWRGYAQRHGHAVPAALVEDAAAILLSSAATRQ